MKQWSSETHEEVASKASRWMVGLHRHLEMRSGLVHNDGYGGEQNHRLPRAQVGSGSCKDTVAMSKVGGLGIVWP